MKTEIALDWLTEAWEKSVAKTRRNVTRIGAGFRMPARMESTSWSRRIGGRPALAWDAVASVQ